MMRQASPLLSIRERQVIHYLSTGLTREKIARQMAISPETVKMHLKNIYRKLNVHNRIEVLRKVKLL